ncbi:MAG: CaiB/BaiF CoA-transferase family protein [Chloroflexota bacterium]
MTATALDGIRVLDFTRILAGPTCTMLLADLGADVIKVENPGKGDDTRHWGPPWLGTGDDRQSAYFLSVNRNKRSLTLNLKTEAGQNIAKKLATRSHVVIENFKRGQMDGFGLGYHNLKQVNPALVYCSITGFGQTGPYSQRPGYDYVIQAMSGLMSITGPTDGDPHKVGVATADIYAGLFATTAIQAALRHSERTRQGQYIDTSLLDSQIAALVNIASNFLVSGMTPPRLGNLHPNIVPYQTFRAADGEFVLAVGNDRQFRLLCGMIERQDLLEDPRYATNPARVENRDTLVPILQEIFAQQPRKRWISSLLENGIPAGPINDVGTALHDPHVQARGMVAEAAHPNGETLRYVASPLKLSETPAEMRTPPPLLGQHTDEILTDLLNLNPADINDYRQQGVI